MPYALTGWAIFKIGFYGALGFYAGRAAYTLLCAFGESAVRHIGRLFW